MAWLGTVHIGYWMSLVHVRTHATPGAVVLSVYICTLCVCTPSEPLVGMCHI